jgi:hypothetical protein
LYFSEKLPEENNRPEGKNSPNLVTLLAMEILGTLLFLEQVSR